MFFALHCDTIVHLDAACRFLHLEFLLNKIILLIAFSIIISSIITGCSKRADGTRKIPLVYRVDIQQGNVIEQSMINKLEPGMSKSKVRFIMGTPLLVDPFHSNRWEYIYSIEPGGGERAQRHIAVFFKDDKLTHLEGDITTVYGRSNEEDSSETSNIIVTGERKEKGLFGRLFGSDKKKKGDDEGFFGRWFGTEDELKKADESRDEETRKELESLAEGTSEQAEDSILPLPERDADQIERDFEVLEKTEEQF